MSFRALQSLFVLLALSAVIFAQTSTTQLGGTVTDSSGATVPGAVVNAVNEATGVKYTQSTTAAGLYTFPSIPAGSYTLHVEALGFKKYSVSQVVLQINTPASVNATLELGGANESIDVVAGAETIQTNNAVIGNVVERKAIESLPLNGRNPLNLLMYEPGVVQRSGNQVNVNGSRGTAVNVTIDGIDANESTYPNPTNNIFRINPDNVQEFKVTTSNPSAEEGRNSGANISVATRSGTNQFHGTAFEFFRNTALNANEFFARAQGQEKPIIKMNQYGFELGGPIRKNKTFFFGSWQGQQVNFADPIDKVLGSTVNLYSPTALAGNYRYFVVDPRSPFQLNGTTITQNTPLLVDPRSGALAPGVRNCAANTDINCVASFNIFQNGGMDSAVKRVLGGYPAPNSYAAGDGLNLGIYSWNTPFKIRGPQYLARIDHTINDRHNLFGRWLGAEQNTLNGDPLNGRPQVLPGYPARGEVFRPAHNIAIGLRSTLSPRLVNEFTVGFSRFNFLFTQGEANPLFPNTPRFTFNNSSVDYTSNPRSARIVNTIQYVNNLTYINGAHVYKFGGNVRFYQHNDQRGDVGGTSLVPVISLSRTIRPPTGITLPALSGASAAGIASVDFNRLQGSVNDLLGIPAQLSNVFIGDLRSDTFLPFQTGPKSVSLWAQGQRTKQYNFFAQDEWRATRNLSISYGVRWEINAPPTEAGNRVYVPNKNIDGSQGLVSFVHADRWYQNFNWGAFAPRLGISWAPGGSNKMVVRAGYSQAFDPINTFQATSIATAVPGQTFSCVATVGGASTPGCGSVPDLRLGDGFPNALSVPTAKPSSQLTPSISTYNVAPAARVFDQNLKLPTVHMWNLTIQREIGKGYVGSIGYVGRRGTRLYRSYDANQVNAEPILPSFLAMQKNLSISGCRADGTMASGSPCIGASAVPLIQQGIITSAFANSATSASELSITQNAAGSMANRIEQTTNAARLRPNQQFWQALYLDNGADSIYHSFQATFRKRFDAAGVLLGGSYTLSKSIDNLSIDPVAVSAGGGLTSTNARTPADSRNYDNERGRSDFDQRHVINMSGIYELPLGKGKMLLGNAGRVTQLVAGGWSLNAIFTYQSGEPFTVRSGVLTANATSQSRAALAPGVTSYPQAKLQNKSGVLGPVMFANASQFVVPGPGELGIGRNVFQGPQYWNLDLGLSKGFIVNERVKLTFRAEAFNALNHPNFRNPRDASTGTPAINSTLFGQTCCVTMSTASSSTTNQNGESWRVIQLALKLNF